MASIRYLCCACSSSSFNICDQDSLTEVQLRRGSSQTLSPTSRGKLKRMFLEGRTPEEIKEAGARAQQQADLKLRQQDALLHHDFDKMRREVETLGEKLCAKLPPQSARQSIPLCTLKSAYEG